MPIATGEVTAFGTSDISDTSRSPIAQPIPVAVSIVTSDPTTSAAAIGSAVARMCRRLA